MYPGTLCVLLLRISSFPEQRGWLCSVARNDQTAAAGSPVVRQSESNPATSIAFSLDRAGPVSLAIYNLAGHKVANLVEGELGTGRHQFSWQPRDLPSGTYVYRLRTQNAELSRKCSLLK